MMRLFSSERTVFMHGSHWTRADRNIKERYSQTTTIVRGFAKPVNGANHADTKVERLARRQPRFVPGSIFTSVRHVFAEAEAETVDFRFVQALFCHPLFRFECQQYAIGR